MWSGAFAVPLDLQSTLGGTTLSFSLAVKAAFVLLTFGGLASLWAAIAADMGASLLVIFNGLRLLRGRAAAGCGEQGEEGPEDSVHLRPPSGSVAGRAG